MTKLQTSLANEETWVDGATERLSALPTATSAFELDVSTKPAHNSSTHTHHQLAHQITNFHYTLLPKCLFFLSTFMMSLYHYSVYHETSRSSFTYSISQSMSKRNLGTVISSLVLPSKAQHTRQMMYYSLYSYSTYFLVLCFDSSICVFFYVFRSQICYQLNSCWLIYFSCLLYYYYFFQFNSMFLLLNTFIQFILLNTFSFTVWIYRYFLVGKKFICFVYL